MQYRREIDGLRAVAVVPVILFHAGFSWFSGGYVGVDVFFVISGFLITSILMNDLAQGRFSIVRFYERRARRILPALFFVMICSIPMAWAWMMPIQLEEFSQALIAIILFVSNILYWQKSGYFEPAAEENPMLHTWSLAVEEQFYVFFPLLLMAIWGFGRNRVFIVILSISAVSLVLAEFGWRFFPSANFYLLPTRVWELGAGAICALLSNGKAQKESSILSGLGLGCIIYAIFSFDETTPFPSVYALIPVVGTSLIILFGSSNTLSGRLLSTKGFVAIGLVSFSAYLWHQPLFAFSRIASVQPPGTAVMGMMSFCSLVLAYITYKFVETPFRKPSARLLPTRRWVFSVSSIAASCIVSIGIYGFLSDGVTGRFGKTLNSIAQAVNDRSRFYHCQSEPGNIIAQENACVIGDNKNIVAALVGDSHATALTEEISKQAAEKEFGVKVLTYSGCSPAVGLDREGRNCDSFNRKNIEYIKNSGFDYVIMASRWSLHYSGERFDNQEGGKEYGGEVDMMPVDVNISNEKGRRHEVMARIKQTVEEYLNSGVNVVLVWNIPEAGWDVPQYLFKTYLDKGSVDIADASTDYEVYQQRNGKIHSAFASIEQPRGGGRLINVKPGEFLCDTRLEGRCVTNEDDIPLYFDDDHLSNSGARLLASAIAEPIANTK